jgi:uncharacterized protein YcfL
VRSWISVLLVLGALCGCSAPGGYQFTEQGLPYELELPGFLERAGVEVGQVTSTFQRGLLGVRIDLRHQGQVAIDFHSFFEWLDRYGMEVKSPASARRLHHLEPGQTLSIENIAPSPKCHRVVAHLID